MNAEAATLLSVLIIRTLEAAADRYNEDNEDSVIGPLAKTIVDKYSAKKRTLDFQTAARQSKAEGIAELLQKYA